MLKRRIKTLVIVLLTAVTAYGQADSSHLRVSLLTCGTGPEVWETFGHTAIRVTDSMRGTDDVYNYGTFSFGPDFTMQFMRGKLLYYLSYYPYNNFVEEYREANRSLQEQVLLLDGDKKWKIYEFLQKNALPDNRYYKYDFFFDNCATRIRDVFPNSLGKNFQFGTTIAAKERLTYRNIINQYYYKKHWERFGVNLLLGSRIDSVMSNEDIMFLPDFLRDGVGDATVNGRKIATEPTVVLTGSPHEAAGLNEPLILTSILAILTIGGLAFRRGNALGKVMSFLLLFATGLLGCLMLVMWFGTDHQGCGNNFNILWALPTNLFLAFAPKRNKGRYAIIAIILLIISLLLHVFRVQELPLLELFPILLSLLFIYGTIYRRNVKTA